MPKLVVKFKRPLVVREADELTITITADADDADALRRLPKLFMLESWAFDAMTRTGPIHDVETNLRNMIEVEGGFPCEVDIEEKGFVELEGLKPVTVEVKED